MSGKGGLSLQFIRNLINLFFAALVVAIIFFSFTAKIEVKNVINENEVLINRKIILSENLLSSEELAYKNENGINKGVIDFIKLSSLTPEALFNKYSYKPDDINKRGYSHYVRVDVLEPKKEAIKEFLQPGITSSQAQISLMEFPVVIRYSDDDMRLGKIYVNIIGK